MGRRHGWHVLAGVVGLAMAGCQVVPPNGFRLHQGRFVEDGQGEGQARELPPAETTRVCLTTADELFKKGQDREAIALYEKARGVDPSQKQVCRRLAILYDRQGEFQRSQAEYEKALSLYPKSADVYNDLGYSWYCRGNWAEAEKHLRKAVELNSRHTRAWVNLGLVLGQQGKYTESLQAFGKAVPPGQAQANLGFLLTAQGKREEAKQAYRRALQQDPDLTMARAALDKLEGRTPPPPPAPVAVRDRKPARRKAPNDPTKENPQVAVAGSKSTGTAAQVRPPVISSGYVIFDSAPESETPATIPSTYGKPGH
ncbi:MAG: tetratricopeptide repeat protein [Planctomycetes bacterium]|nr:tetratricopeptide repeat protein [Planctomycetota bacterium]